MSPRAAAAARAARPTSAAARIGPPRVRRHAGVSLRPVDRWSRLRSDRPAGIPRATIVTIRAARSSRPGRTRCDRPATSGPSRDRPRGWQSRGARSRSLGRSSGSPERRAERGRGHGGGPDQVPVLPVQPAPGRLARRRSGGRRLPEVLGRAGRARPDDPDPTAPSRSGLRDRRTASVGPLDPGVAGSTSWTSAPKTSGSSRATTGARVRSTPPPARGRHRSTPRRRPSAADRGGRRRPSPRPRPAVVDAASPARPPRSAAASHRPSRAGPPGAPPIQVDAAGSSPSRRAATAVASRDLVLPRSVVASWSLFVLLALVLRLLRGPARRALRLAGPLTSRRARLLVATPAWISMGVSSR